MLSLIQNGIVVFLFPISEKISRHNNIFPINKKKRNYNAIKIPINKIFGTLEPD